MSLASMSSFAGEEDLHGLASTMFPRLEAQLREAEKGFTSTLLRFCPDRAVMELEVLARAKATNEVRKIHGFHVICPLVCLPSEVLVSNILRRLDPVSLCRVSMTCAFLYELASDNLLWRGLYDEWERKWENVSRKVRTFGVYMSDSELLFAASDDDGDDGDDDGGDDGDDSSDELDDMDKERSSSDDGDGGGQKVYEEMKEEGDDDDDDEEDEKAGNDDSDEQLQQNASESEGDNMEIDEQRRPNVKIGSNRALNRLPKRKANAKQKTKAKTKTVKRTKEEKRPAIKKTQATRAKAKSPAAALINSSPAGPYSGKIVPFTAFNNTSASDVPTKRKGSAIIGGGGATGLRPKGLEFDSAADNLYSNPAPHRVQAMVREESDGERREREKMVHDMQREWRRLLDRVARREAHDERAHAFYWKHCFRELEIQALNRKKKDVSARKRGALHKLLARPGTNLSLQAAVFPLPLKWLLAKETAAAAAAAAHDGSKPKTGAATSPRARRGSVTAANGLDESPFQSIVSKVFENNKRLFSLRNPFDAFDEDAQNRPGNLPPNEEWLHFGRLREVRGGDNLLEIVFSVKGDDRDIQKQRATTLTFIKEMRALLGGEIEGIWEDVDYGFGGGDSHRLVVFSTPGRKGLLLQWSWENNSNLLQPWHQ